MTVETVPWRAVGKWVQPHDYRWGPHGAGEKQRPPGWRVTHKWQVTSDSKGRGAARAGLALKVAELINKQSLLIPKTGLCANLF